MPANSTGQFWGILAYTTGRLGHLYSPGGQRGPFEWFPYALDNGAYSCWEPETNTFRDDKWAEMEVRWRELLKWSEENEQRPRWAIVPDVPGNAERTIARWAEYAPIVAAAGIPLAVAVQDGMTVEDVRGLFPKPEVICIGGSTAWKWWTVKMWVAAFPRVHVLRCNAPSKLELLEDLGIESIDGTGWNRGDPRQTSGLVAWCQKNPRPYSCPIVPRVSRGRSVDRNPPRRPVAPYRDPSQTEMFGNRVDDSTLQV